MIMCYAYVWRGMFVLWMMFGLLTGCSVVTHPASGLTQTVDGLTVTLTATTQPVVASAQSWHIIVTDATGAPVEDAEVYLDLVMPGMAMGQQKPWATPQGNGRYIAEGAYTMDGPWQVIVHVEIDRVDHTVPFRIDVQP